MTEATFQKKFQELRPILDAEARVRQQLAKLDLQLSQVRTESDKTEGYQVSGTDILWNGWESATRRQLNMQVAQIRAQKLAAVEALRFAFGRKQAVEALGEKFHQKHSLKAARKLVE
ncbi:hypothetical protein [Ruegeria sp. HKCCD5849]|uniref:hypothetical protein n=1 Tax=unclassified Ruegeria TaxID=2625375 RepID=UPI003530482A